MGSEVLTKDGFRLYYHPSSKKKYKATVVFVHHMWGNHKTTWRHYRYLNDKGFDCVTFDLLMGSNSRNFKFHPLMKFFYKGVFYIWSRQIRSILDSVKGDKVVFAFSGPSLSTFWACNGRTDILKLICDGGPFDHIYKNSRNFFRIEFGITNRYLNAVVTWIGSLIWGYKPLPKLHKVLFQWSRSVPILSIRGCKDNIVALDSIRSIFNRHKNLRLEELELPYGKHLDGMREFPDQYCKTLMPFLKKDLPKL